ncbi:MAG TPA: V-type ATP synthase subunit E family protein [Negativicutes bacterium]|nr:V-type ATP synthase subunit E family protein [Negativicutes bacterium]
MGVSVEDKIELFRNVIIKEIEEAVNEDRLKANESFEQEKSRLLAEVQAKRDLLVKEAVKKAEKEKQQLIAKARSNAYHRLLDSKQQFIGELTERLMEKAAGYTGEEAYKDYLSKSLDKAARVFEDSPSVQLYFTKKDMEELSVFIEKRLSEGSLKGKYSLKAADSNILGGFYAEDGNGKIQVDYTLVSLIKENQELVGNYISRRFGEVQGNG